MIINDYSFIINELVIYCLPKVERVLSVKLHDAMDTVCLPQSGHKVIITAVSTSVRGVCYD